MFSFRRLFLHVINIATKKKKNSAAKDVYEPIIISPFYNKTTDHLTAYVTSDLWSKASGTVNFAWYDWSGNRLDSEDDTPDSKSFEVGPLNSTKVLHTGLGDTTLNLTNAVLYMNVTARGAHPNSGNGGGSDEPVTFNHENFFHPVPLSEANLVDPGLTLRYSKETGNFTVTATRGIAAWTWLDYDQSKTHGGDDDDEDNTAVRTVGNFESNGFWLLQGREREVGFKAKKDETGGRWVDGVTVQSIWNNTLQE